MILTLRGKSESAIVVVQSARSFISTFIKHTIRQLLQLLAKKARCMLFSGETRVVYHMKSELYSYDEVLSEISDRLKSGWCLLFGNRDAISAIEENYFTGDEANYFIRTLAHSKSRSVFTFSLMKPHSEEARSKFFQPSTGLLPLALCLLGIRSDGDLIAWGKEARTSEARERLAPEVAKIFVDIFYEEQYPAGSNPYDVWLERNGFPMDKYKDIE